MYLWNTQALADELKRGPLPEIEQLKYFLIISATTTASMLLPNTSTAESLPPWAAMVSNVMYIVLGTLWCFKTNAAGDNRDFVSRFLALLVPIGLRFGALLLVIAVSAGVILAANDISCVTGTGGTIGEIAFGVLFSLAFYWRVSVRIAEISKAGNPVVNAPSQTGQIQQPFK